MLTAEARVATDRASRYLVQLSRHAGHLERRHADRAQHAEGHRPRARQRGGTSPAVEHTEWSDTQGTITFPWGRCTLRATPDALAVRVEATDAEHLQQIQDGIARRIETIGRRGGLTVDWHLSESPDGDSGQPGPAPTPGGAAKPRGRWQLLGLIAAGGLLLVMHLGPLAALLAASWAKGVTDVVLVLILLKVLTVAGHGLLGFVAVRRRKQGRPLGPAGLLPRHVQDLLGGRVGGRPGLSGHRVRLPKRRGIWRTLGAIAIGAIVVAGHLGLFGGAVAAMALQGQAGDTIVAVIVVLALLKVGTVVTCLVVGRLTARRRAGSDPTG